MLKNKIMIALDYFCVYQAMVMMQTFHGLDYIS